MELMVDEVPGVRLRRPRPTDVERITAICQDPAIQRFTRVPIPYTTADAQAFVDGVGDAWDLGVPRVFGVTVDDVLVGMAGLVHVDGADRLAEVGYWTAPSARKQGITTAAVRRVCRWAFEDVGFERLELQTADGNRGSEIVAERVGFRREGVRRSAAVLRAVDGLPETRADVTMWGLLPTELR